eukprot:g80550.t1
MTPGRITEFKSVNRVVRLRLFLASLQCRHVVLFVPGVAWSAFKLRCTGAFFFEDTVPSLKVLKARNVCYVFRTVPQACSSSSSGTGVRPYPAVRHKF